jgi:predicted RNase H-like HicB family nuclease
MRDYAAVFEKTSTGWSAYCPDLPGLGVAGPTYEATEQLLREGIAFHIDGMIADGDPIPEPTTRVALLPVQAA